MKAWARLRRILSWRHAMLSGALVVLATGSLRPLPFTKELPPGVPHLSRWTKASGSEELDGKLLQYELYFNPGRSDYEVIRYRLTGGIAADGQPYSANERLQWQAALKDLRRFECEPLVAGGCHWRELDRKGPEYARELGMVMRVLGLHRRLLYQRESGR